MENKRIKCGGHEIIIKYDSKSIVILSEKPSLLFSVEPSIIDMKELINEVPDLEALTIKDVPIENIRNFECLYNINTLKSAKLEMLNLKNVDFLNNIPSLERISLYSNPLKDNVNKIDYNRFETVVLDFEQGMYLNLNNIPDSVAVFFRGLFDVYPTKISEMKELKNKVHEITSEILRYPDMTDLEKILFVHNYLQRNIQYRARKFKVDGKEFSDREILNDPSAWTSVFNPYGALVKNTALCNGIASSMYLILNHPDVNVKCEYAGGYSEGMEHIWNVVYIDGELYHVDTTFDILKNSNKIPNIFKAKRLSTRYFLISDNEIKKDRQLSNKGFPNCLKSYPKDKIEESIERMSALGIRFSYKESKVPDSKKSRNVVDDIFF